MRNITIRYAKGILLTVIASLLVFKILWLNKVNFEIDTLENQLAQVQKCIKTGSRIGFYSNNDKTLFMVVNYVMAPRPIQQNYKTDTILLIQNKTAVVKIFEHYHAIVQRQDGDINISLIVKDK